MRRRDHYAAAVSLGQTLLSEGDSTALAELPGEVLTRAAREIITILASPQKYRSFTEYNIMVGRKYFGFDVLRAHLQDVLHWVSCLHS